MRPTSAVTPEIVRYRNTVEGPRILDLGCGTGERAIALARRRFNRVTGLDAARNLIDLAAQQAVKRRVEVTFVCGDPGATPFPAGSFDEVMILGGLFGHTGSARGDVQLLREAGRLLELGGCLHLKFADGDWIRANYRADAVEGLPTGSYIGSVRFLAMATFCAPTFFPPARSLESGARKPSSSIYILPGK